MNDEPKPQIDGMNETGRFYIIFSELAKQGAEDTASDVPYDEIEEIQEVMRMVVDLNDQPAQFVTST